MEKFDVRNFTNSDRERLANSIRLKKDFKLPKLDVWNYDLCRKHRNGWSEEYYDKETDTDKSRTITERPKPGCRKCGIHFRQHQRVSIMWLYLKKRALLADTMGPQPLSSKVLTPYGWVTMGQMQEGDLVVDPITGAYTRVEQTRSKGVRKVYKVTFTDGSSARAADIHEWEVNTPDRKFHKRPPKIMSTEELLSSGLQYANGNNKWYIPMTEAVELESGTSWSVDPYTVGVLLGDGSTREGSIILSTYSAIIEELNVPEDVTLVPIKLSRETASYHVEYRLTGMRKHIEGTSIIGNSTEKFVPSEYMLAPAADRLRVLQGLLDTDGTPTEGGGIEWGTVSNKLADDMEFLVNSLGGTFARSEKLPTYVYAGEKRTGQVFYRFYISLPGNVEPFTLKRKSEKYKTPTKYQPTRGIVSIEFDGEEEVKCISVASEEHLYLTDNFIVTRNSGKTTSAGGLLAMLKQTGELGITRDSVGRAIIVPRSPALHQWYDELLRMIPGLNVAIAEGSQKKRKNLYQQPWEVLLIGPDMLRNDYELLKKFPLSLVLTDDIDQLRNPETLTSYTLDKLGNSSDRYVIMTGTPLQKRLPELHAILDGIGGLALLGPLTAFVKSHVRYATVNTEDAQGNVTSKQQIVGYRNLDTVKRRIAPLVLRRTAADLVDVTLPTIITDDVMLELYPKQKAKYKELQKGVIQILKEEGTQTKHVAAIAKLHYGSAICAGLTALGEEDGPRTSVKLDWVIDKVSEGGDLGDEKVVIFANLKLTVRALQKRLAAEGIKFVTVWGEETNKMVRRAAQEQFWEDPECRVLIGTRAIEQSLNLQVSRHLINIDMILNPARMEQLAGRIRRDGSAYQHVFVHNLLTVGTQEERYLPLLEREAALSSHIWDENSELFQALDAQALLRLISG